MRRSSGQGSGREFEVRIERVAYGGDGVGRVDGKVCFVPFCIPGELVRARVVREKSRFCEARLVSVIEPSPLRQKPKCSVFGVCGGCAYQQVEYGVQLEWKRGQVRDLFERIAGIANPPVRETVASPLQWGYRNRIRVHVKSGCAGFFQRQSSEVVEVAHCPIASEGVNGKLEGLVAGRTRDGEYTLSERPWVRFFEQTNDGAADELLRVVGGLLPSGGRLLLDAYCGAGFFGRALAGSFDRVVGVEVHGGAVEEARRRAGPKESYVCGDVASVIGEVLESAGSEGVTVLLDPPAEGVAPRVLELLAAFPVGNVIYVSCDPATQARDAKTLLSSGYRLREVVPVDMFPQTADVEVVALFSRA